MAVVGELDLVSGDTLPTMSCVLSGIDITGYSIELHLKRPDGTVLTRPATIINAANGHFAIVWLAGDLIPGYGQEAEIEITNDTGGIQTTPLFLINVRKELA